MSARSNSPRATRPRTSAMGRSRTSAAMPTAARSPATRRAASVRPTEPEATRSATVMRGGERMTVALLVASGSVGRTDAARRVAGDLAAVGIAAEVRERPIADVLGLVARGEFDLALMPQRADDPDVATEVYRGLAGPWFDALAAAVRSTADRGEKRSLYAEMQRVWSSELPALPLYQHLQ